MHVVPHSPLSKKTLSFLSSPLSTLTSLYLIAAFSFPPFTISKPSLPAPETKSLKLLRILWVVPWVCDLSLYSNRFVMGLWFVMWVCVLWWLYGIWTCIASIFLSTLSLWVCVLCFVVFYDVGLVDQRHFDSSGLIQYFSGGWVFDSMGFYMDFMSTTVNELATKRRWGMPKREREREREKERKRENIFLMREEREI